MAARVRGPGSVPIASGTAGPAGPFGDKLGVECVTAAALRAKVFAELEELGFRPVRSLPDPDPGRPVRPPGEVAARLMALDALFTWVAYSEEDVATDRIESYLDRDGLRGRLTEDEAAIVAL